jgi:hypothetical protein
VALNVATLLHLGLAPGLPDDEAERLWSDCFQPLIGALHHTPDFRVGVVLAGEIVEDWLQRHPEAIEWLRALIQRNQVELVGTAMHEPVLSAVPERDAVGQLVAHATQLKKVFGVRPTGAWLPHGAWDPCVPRILRAADLSWVAVDDRLVSAALPEGTPVAGVWRTEREGQTVALLPVDGAAADAAPDTSVKQILWHLERQARQGASVVTLAFDATRFATRRDQSWLATLMVALARAGQAFGTARPSDAVQEAPTRGRVYLAAGRAGDPHPWERALLRYDEANRLHKRMLRASRLVERLDKMVKDGGPGGFTPDPSQLVQAHRYLYRAQSAPVYAHGPHAGVYDARARALAWRDVIRAERTASEAMRIDDRLVVETADLDGDGTEDVVLRTPSSTVLLDRARSAGLAEWSVHGVARNLCDTLTRRPEPYHEGLDRALDEDGPTASGLEDEVTDAPLGGPNPALARALRVDPRPRVGCAEHLIGPEVTLDGLMRGAFARIGRGLGDRPWQLLSADKYGDDSLRALFSAEGTVEDLGGEKAVRLHKRYTLHREPMLDFRVEVTNLGHEALRCRLAVELDLTPSPGDPPWLVVHQDRRATTSPGDAGEVSELRLESADLTLHLVLRKAARLWHYPVETVHRDRGTLVKGFQAVCMVLVWPVELFTNEKAKFDLRLAVET